MSKKKSTKKSNEKQTLASTTMHERFADLFIISMFAIFPFFMTNMLFNVRKDRLHYFVATTFILLFFILATYICGIDKDKAPKRLFKTSVSDWGMIAFLVICTLSTIFSKYGMEAVTGEKGRDSGLFLMAVYVLSYFLISRYFNPKTYVFNIFVISACLVCVIAILHEFYVDPLRILVDIKEEQQDTFITTIGNKNLFSCFVCVAMPVMAALLVKSEDWATSIFYCVATGISFMGLLVADSDSGYFGVAAFMLVLFVYSCGNFARMFRYSLCIFTMLFSCKVLRLISLVFNDNMKTLDTIPNTLIFGKEVYVLIGISAVIAVFFFLLSRKFGDTHSPKWVQVIAGAFVALCALTLLFLFVYFSAINTEAELGSLSKYLRLNDQWGTHRGYAWIRSIILFKSNGIKNVLIGSGPDTFGQMMKEVYREDMLQRHGSVFDSAHNEYLNYLVTVGILGVAAYLTVIVSVLWRGLRRCKNSIHLLVITLVIISYCSQAIFNLATPITTPYIFVFLAMGEAAIRRYDFENAEIKASEISNLKQKAIMN